MHLTS